MMLIVHGELELVQANQSDEFLKKLNVYHEITNMKHRLDENKYQLSELTPLFSTDDKLCESSRLQAFINKVVVYAQIKEKLYGQGITMMKLESSSAFA